jgi:L,D-peptidoglycan transpeptidase YkuD (ErfK/YbiS/YcfS/YnhG family)
MVGVKQLLGASAVLLAACLCAGCGSGPLWAHPNAPTAPASTATPASAATPATTQAPAKAQAKSETKAKAKPQPPRCPSYSTATYGTDPDQIADTGGGTELVTVVAPTSAAVTVRPAAARLTPWVKNTNGCWSPVEFTGQPAPPFPAETGQGGLLPYSRRVPGDYATPIGLYSFGTVMYGNSPVSPTTRYPYHHFVCGDWWNEQPGSPTYDEFQHVPCAITPAYAADSEALWTEVQPYQHFIDIQMPAPPDNGAGIFLHDDMAVGYTEGCVALPNAELDAVLGWLNPAAHPHILISVSA